MTTDALSLTAQTAALAEATTRMVRLLPSRPLQSLLAGVLLSADVLVVRASDPLTGEAEEAVKASVRGDHLTRSYQARLLTDALRPFARRTVLVRVQDGMRATAFTVPPTEEADVDLRYLVVPMRTPDDDPGDR